MPGVLISPVAVPADSRPRPGLLFPAAPTSGQLDPDAAAVTLTRIAAEESHGTGPLAGRIREVVLEFVERNGVEGLTQLTIALARQHFAARDPLARTTGETPVNELLDAVELAALEDSAEED